MLVCWSWHALPPELLLLQPQTLEAQAGSGSGAAAVSVSLPGVQRYGVASLAAGQYTATLEGAEVRDGRVMTHSPKLADVAIVFRCDAFPIPS